jgi:D-ribulokinase
LRQIIETQAQAGAPIESVMISGGAGRQDLVRQLLADATGKRVLATEAEEPVLLGSAILGAVAGGAYPAVEDAMTRMSRVSRVYEPDADVAARHTERYRAFEQLQTVARSIRAS